MKREDLEAGLLLSNEINFFRGRLKIIQDVESVSKATLQVGKYNVTLQGSLLAKVIKIIQDDSMENVTSLEKRLEEL